MGYGAINVRMLKVEGLISFSSVCLEMVNSKKEKSLLSFLLYKNIAYGQICSICFSH